MSARKHRTSPGGVAQGRRRLRVAEQYLSLATLLEEDSTEGAINACIGNCVLAGIAAADAICYSRLGERYSGPDHDQAADVLDRVSKEYGSALRALTKPGSTDFPRDERHFRGVMGAAAMRRQTGGLLSVDDAANTPLKGRAVAGNRWIQVKPGSTDPSLLRDP